MADPEFHNGGADARGEGSAEGTVPPPQKKIEFLPENGRFWCILYRITFYVSAKIGQVIGGGGCPPPPSGSATGAGVTVKK